VDLPIADIEASIADEELQRTAYGELDRRTRAGLDAVRGETVGENAPESIRWVYFRSPESSWCQEAGVEGWLLYDAHSKEQHAFMMTAIS
jgi:hypothetical protein